MANAKTPLVLMPGLLCNDALWRHQIDTLADVAEVTVADMSRDESLKGMAERMLAAAPERFALAGLSMGGYAAFEVMRLAPQRVERLALLDTSARADTEERRDERLKAMNLVERGNFQGMTRKLLPWFVHEDRVDDERLMSIIKKSAQDVGNEAFIRQQTAIMGRPDSRADLARIACPTLVLGGRQDRMTPPALHDEMAAEIPGARLVVVEDCGHLAPLEQPHAVSAVLRYWLQDGAAA